jgi:hypothetical protein
MKNFLLFFSFWAFSIMVNGQAVAWEMSAEPGNQASSVATLQSSNFNNCILTRGSGVTATAGAGSMNSAGWFSGSTPTTLDDAIAGNDYYEFTINIINCLFFNPTTIRIVLRSSATGPNTATLRCSSDGFTTNIGTVTVPTTSTEFTFSETVSPNSQTITFRLYGYGTAAGGGTPGSGGTMRIGTSVVATDNDIAFFASTTFVTVNTVSNISVFDGDLVPSTVFGANVPGATFNWTRTPESIGLMPTNGVGNVPAFNAFNASGIPVTSTFTVNATVGNCTSQDIMFTITVNPAPCTITVDFFGNPSPCNDNGTPTDPTDDFFTQNIHASFFNRPATGDLQIVPGGDQIGTYSIPVVQIIGNSHTFIGVQLKADGTPTNIQMNFTDEPTCIDAAVGPTVNSCSLGQDPCDITGVSIINVTSCNDNGTGDPSDDYYLADVSINYINPPATGNLQIEPGGDAIGTNSVPVANLMGNSHTFEAVQLKADGTPTVIEVEFTIPANVCVQTAVGPTIASCSPVCDITSIDFINILSCNDNNTGDPNDDYFIADVVVNFVNPPATGNLQIEPGGDAIGTYSIPVTNLIGNSHTFEDVQLKADGTITVLEVEFTIPANVCVQTVVGPTIASCSSECTITNIQIVNPEPCNDNGTPGDPTDDYYLADILISFENPPATGLLSVSGSDLVDGDFSTAIANVLATGSPFGFSNKKFKADGLFTTVLVEFTDAPGCIAGFSTVNGVDPCSFPAPIITCPVAVTVSCANQVPAPNPASVTETHTCPGGVIKTHLGDVISNQTCTNRYTITRTYQVADECDNTASCSQVITVADNTAPSITCPVAVTVQCASQVPAPGIGGVVSVDNCGGATTVVHVSDVTVNQTCVNRYTINRTFNSTDVCGNSVTCVQTITVFDNTGPSITCPPAVTVQCANQVPAPNIAGVVSADNCGSAVTVIHVSDVTVNQTCVNRFTINRTYKSTDICGNSATCVQTITVFDNTLPTITCPVNLTVQCATLVPVPNPAGLATSDNCSGPLPVVTFVNDVTTNQICVNRYTLTRTYRSTDACGNSATCTQVITVFDNTPPVIAFTHPLLQGVANGGRIDVQCFAQDPNWDLPDFDESSISVSDNCTGTGSVSFSQILQDAGDCSVDGYINLYRLTWTASDACGNSSTAFVFLALVDTIPPVIEGIPADITVNCDEIPAPPGNITVSDECIEASIVLYHETSLAPGCQDGQVITRSWTARDECGNETIERQHITLVDQKGPQLQLLQPELAGLADGAILYYTCNEGGIPAFFDELDDETAYSEPSCGTPGIISFDLDFDEANNCEMFGYLEQKTAHWRAVDQCGNETNLTIYARLIDNEEPFLIGVPDIACIDDPALDNVDAFDNCGHPSIRYWDVSIPNPCGDGIAFRRTYEVYDECGNMSRDTAILIPNNDNAPLIHFTNPVLANLQPGVKLEVNCSANNGQYTSFGVHDIRAESECDANVNIVFVERVLERNDCALGIVNTLSLEWTATDLCGNSSSKTVEVSVFDLEAPSFTNLIAELSIGCQDSLPKVSATDNCGDVILHSEETIIPGACIYEYDVVRQLIATDPCGNVTHATQTIHVGRSSGPVIEGVVPELCDDLSIPKVTAYDPCAQESVEVVMTEKELNTSCREGRVIERTWSATDQCGRVTEIRQVIIVNDHTPPQIQIPTYSVILRFLDQPKNQVLLSQTNLIGQLDDLSAYSVFIEDECDQAIETIFTLDISHSDDCQEDGYWERRIYTWMATDICGNQSSISFSVDIMDDIAPAFTGVPADETVICQPLPPAALVQVVDSALPVNTSYTESIKPGNAPGEFNVTRQWDATDACGNHASTSQHIYWIPDTHLSCSILAPGLVECNSHQVMISSAVSGGLGALSYEWELIGDQCFIQGGQGTNTLFIYIGWAEVEIVLTVVDAYGCSTTCTTNLDCFDTSVDFNTGSNPNLDPKEGGGIKGINPNTMIQSSSSGDWNEIQVWPNPARESLSVSFKALQEESIEFSLVNLLGEVVYVNHYIGHKGFNTHSIDISTLEAGGYMLQMKSKQDLISSRLVIVH